jgi:hypothetical protein
MLRSTDASAGTSADEQLMRQSILWLASNYEGRTEYRADCGAAGKSAPANMLNGLLHGQALTASEFAREAGSMLSTVSEHLGKLAHAVVTIEKEGRHHYCWLSGADVASVLGGLMGWPPALGIRACAPAPRDPELRRGLLRSFCGRRRGAHV